MADYEMDSTSFRKVMEAAASYANDAEKVINEYLWDEGSKAIMEDALKRIHPSGRNWKGKKPGAVSAGIKKVFTVEKLSLATRVHTRNAYHYLYFPDDGSNTNRHYGAQQFMIEGAEEAADKITDDLLDKLTDKINGG